MDPSTMTFAQDYCAGYMLSELVGLEPRTQLAGVTVVADASGFTWRHLMLFSLEDAKNASAFVQECFPIFFR